MAKKTKKNNKSAPYYLRYEQELKQIINDYRQSKQSPHLFASSDFAVFNTIEANGITNHPPREYQMEALYLMDYIHALSASSSIKQDLLEKVDEETNKHAPFLSFEMATGSGKTMLMGACIYALNQKYQIKNFLIITPPSTDIYQKTIRNFMMGGYESVWADDSPFQFNLITGDNYSQSLFYKNNADANIFVFNISKFGTNATNTEKTWESAIWQDENGNQISIKQYLKDKKLVIITDEAHHAQNIASMKIIKNFHPDLVLEFTATAVEQTKKDEKKAQSVIYKYDIRRFLEDGHGKLVRAVALNTEKSKQKGGDIANDEKLKLITFLLIHLLKQEAILLDPKSRSLKALGFVKVKDDTIYTQRIFDYIRNDLPEDIENIAVILAKIKLQDIEITGLLEDLFSNKFKNDIELLRQELRKVVKKSIFYHGKSDKETVNQFNNIRKNDVEIVVYMQKLDEGIDLPNIFTMVVINDSDTEFKTSVKQIIGRGVRLSKDKREFDDETDLLKANAEKLHIVCDQGKNFEEVITAIQQEFGLNSKYFSFDKPKKPIKNTAKSDWLDGKYLPQITAEQKARKGIKLMDLINDIETITNHFIEDNTFEGKDEAKRHFLKLRPDGFFIEVDIFADAQTFHKQMNEVGGEICQLTITEKDQKDTYGIILKNLHSLGDTITIRKAFSQYMSRFNEIGLYYYQLNPTDEHLAHKLFVSAFAFYYRNHIEKNYFELDFRRISSDKSWNLKDKFRNYDFKLPTDQEKNNTRKTLKDRTKLLDLIEKQYHFYGFEKSIYDYDKFDSFIEYQLADYVNEILNAVEDPKKPFWVRNQRNVYFSYGTKKYFPDFIVYFQETIYVVETKGEKFSDIKKNALLRKLDEVPGEEFGLKGFKGLLVFEQTLNKMKHEDWTFEKFLEEVAQAERRRQSSKELVTNPPTEEQFKTYIPVYDTGVAYKHFCKGGKTAKQMGWLPVEEKEYPNTVFATQIKGYALLPQYNHNDWIILKYKESATDSIGKIMLVHSPAIEDEYSENCTVRKVEIIQQASKGLFAENMIHLKGLNEEAETIIIPQTGNTLDIVGVEYE